jgi:hypothetical protein
VPSRSRATDWCAGVEFAERTGTLGPEALANSLGNLAISHLVNGFNSYDASLEGSALDTLFELGLRLARAKYLDGFCITKMRDDVIIVSAEMLRELPLSRVLPRAIP